jgi:hypothetical protein
MDPRNIAENVQNVGRPAALTACKHHPYLQSVYCSRNAFSEYRISAKLPRLFKRETESRGHQGHLGRVQVDVLPRVKHGGTGLGLAISKQLIDLMGGSSGVESSVGQGSKFWFEITLRRSSTGSRADCARSLARIAGVDCRRQRGKPPGSARNSGDLGHAETTALHRAWKRFPSCAGPASREILMIFGCWITTCR